MDSYENGGLRRLRHDIHSSLLNFIFFFITSEIKYVGFYSNLTSSEWCMQFFIVHPSDENGESEELPRHAPLTRSQKQFQTDQNTIWFVNVKINGA